MKSCVQILLALLASACLVAFSSNAQTAISTNNVQINVTSLGLNPAVVTAVTIQGQYWAPLGGTVYVNPPQTLNLSNDPGLTNGIAVFTNQICGIPYSLQIATFYNVVCTNFFIFPTDVPDGTGNINAGNRIGQYLPPASFYFANQVTNMASTPLAAGTNTVVRTVSGTNFVDVLSGAFDIYGAALTASNNILGLITGGALDMNLQSSTGYPASNLVGSVTLAQLPLLPASQTTNLTVTVSNLIGGGLTTAVTNQQSSISVGSGGATINGGATGAIGLNPAGSLTQVSIGTNAVSIAANIGSSTTSLVVSNGAATLLNGSFVGPLVGNASTATYATNANAAAQATNDASGFPLTAIATNTVYVPGSVNFAYVSNRVNYVGINTNTSSGGGVTTNYDSGQLTYYVAPSGSDTNNGLSRQYPFATLHQASWLASNGMRICLMTGTNWNETVAPTNIVILQNIGMDCEAGSVLVLSNRDSLTAAKNGQIAYSAGDVFNNLNILYLDARQDTAWPIGWNNNFSQVIPQTNPAVFNNLHLLSESAGPHMEASSGPDYVVFNNPWIMAQGNCFNFIGTGEHIVVNGGSLTITNWFTNSVPYGPKPQRIVALGMGSGGGTGYDFTVNGGCWQYSDSSTTNKPTCAISIEGAGETNGIPIILNNVTLMPIGLTNGGDFDLMNFNTFSNQVMLASVIRNDGKPITEGTNTTWTIIATNSPVHSYNFPLAPISVTPPGTTSNWTNSLSAKGQLFIDNTGVTFTAIKKNGVTIGTSLGGDVGIMLNAGDFVSETYSVGTPTWNYSPQ